MEFFYLLFIEIFSNDIYDYITCGKPFCTDDGPDSQPITLYSGPLNTLLKYLTIVDEI